MLNKFCLTGLQKSGEQINRNLCHAGSILSVRDAVACGSEAGDERSEKISQIRILRGGRFVQSDRIEAGDVACLLGLSESAAGGILRTGEGSSLSPAAKALLEPVMSYRIGLPDGDDPKTVLPKLARLAEIAGDAAVRDEALYRAARRACPTLARLRMLDYFTRKGLLLKPSVWRASVGYNESGAVFQPRKRPVNDIDLFEMSQGIPQDLISLYGRYGWTELRRDYLSCARQAEGGAGLNWTVSVAVLCGACSSHAGAVEPVIVTGRPAVAIGDALPADELRQRLDRCVASEKLNARLKKDWPGMNTGYYIEYVLHRLSGSPAITDCRDVYLHNATYDPAKGIVRLDVTPGRAAALAVAGCATAGKGLPGEGDQKVRHLRVAAAALARRRNDHDPPRRIRQHDVDHLVELRRVRQRRPSEFANLHIRSSSVSQDPRPRRRRP